MEDIGESRRGARRYGFRKHLFRAGMIALLGAAAFAGVQAMEWPLPGATVAGNFGLNDRGRPLLGAVLSGEGEVLAAADGEVVFAFRDGDPRMSRASGFPSALGSWTAVDHGSGLVGVYARHGGHLASGSPRVWQGEPLALAGSPGVFFMILDREERRWVNPAMLAAPLPDAVPPQILGIWLADGLLGARQVFPPWAAAQEAAQGAPPIAQGRHSVVVAVTDALSAGMGTLLAPHLIVVSVNGAEAGRLTLDAAGARDGALTVSRGSPTPAREVYRFHGFEAADAWFSRGQAVIEVVAEDLAGNRTVAVAFVPVY